MKININFDWAFITSIFTIFLYWCGYWYNYGYAQYFENSINAFDIPIPNMVMDGLIVAVDKFFYLIILFLGVSLVSSITLNGCKKLVLDFFSSFTIIVLFLFHLFYTHLYKKSILIDDNYKKLGMADKSIYVIHEISRKINKNKIYLFLNDNSLIYQHKIKSEKNVIYSKFQFSFILHYLFLIFLLIGVLKFFDVGSALIKNGKKNAQESFIATLQHNKKKSFTKVSISKETQNNINYYRTDLCLKGSCLVTDLKGNSSIHDAKELTVTH
ncbi:hypothetical protein [uncultured Acinetobacter sp.]|uniref:hypothetical protein n=1 Tax=uncultured Acinetobacter sp. TaxID=165433 RepID=UPI00374A5854